MNWSSLPENLLIKMNKILDDLKLYDIQTYNHCLRVSQLSKFLADAAHLSEYEKLQAQISGLLHDVGKMKIPLDVLHKPGKLNEEEYQMVKKHSIFSAELLEPLEHSPFFREVQMNVLHHHERVDGQGYPSQLEDEQIPYISRLILIVDTVDAMTHSRAYRKGLPMEVAYQELEKFAGKQFDKELVTIFIAAHKKLLQQNKPSEVITLTKRIKAA